MTYEIDKKETISWYMGGDHLSTIEYWNDEVL